MPTQTPSFICVDKRDGKVLWTDASPGPNVLHGQWSSPGYAEVNGVPQVFFGGGDGWVYSFDARGDGNGGAKLLWEFDCNPKESKYSLGGRADRNHIIGTPVFHEGLVYIAVGEDPEHGEGTGHLWCIDPKSEVTQALNLQSASKTLTRHYPIVACRQLTRKTARLHVPTRTQPLFGTTRDLIPTETETSFEETMHRTCGTVAIKDGYSLLQILVVFFIALMSRLENPIGHTTCWQRVGDLFC